MKKIICTLLILTAVSAAIIPKTHTQPEEPVYAAKEGTSETVTEVTAEPEPLQAEAITEPEDPIQPESITESTSEDAIEKEDTLRTDNKSEKKENAASDPDDEPAKPEDEFVIDNSVIESCDHVYTRTHGTGGEEGEVWEYVCKKCGYTYFEPYECVDTEADGEMEEHEIPEE